MSRRPLHLSNSQYLLQDFLFSAIFLIWRRFWYQCRFCGEMRCTFDLVFGIGFYPFEISSCFWFARTFWVLRRQTYLLFLFCVAILESFLVAGSVPAVFLWSNLGRRRSSPRLFCRAWCFWEANRSHLCHPKELVLVKRCRNSQNSSSAQWILVESWPNSYYIE